MGNTSPIPCISTSPPTTHIRMVKRVKTRLAMTASYDDVVAGLPALLIMVTILILISSLPDVLLGDGATTWCS